MCSVCGYGCKAQSNASLLVLAQFLKIVRHTDFIHWNPAHICFQPIDKLGHGHAVLDMGPLFIFYFNLILNRFHGCRRVHSVNHFIGTVNQAVHSIVDTAFLQQYPLSPKFLRHAVYTIIRHHGDACSFQVFLHAYVLCILQIRISFSFQHTAVDKEIQLVHGHQGI